VSRDQLGSTEPRFAPSHLPRPCSYLFDAAETAERGSAGSVTLILQTLLILLTSDSDLPKPAKSGGIKIPLGGQNCADHA
jgi:RNA 3'-terminal phosphate cyclase